MTLDPKKVAHELAQRGERWADADAAFRALEDSKHTVLSECIAELNEPDLSATAAEQKARRAHKFKEHLQALSDARREANRAKVSYDAYRMYTELLRSKEATARQEMRFDQTS